MITTITLKDQTSNSIYLSENSVLFIKENAGNQIYQKYFYSKAEFHEPLLELVNDDEDIITIKFKPTVFRSGDEGFISISAFGDYIIRSNISKAEEDDFYRLTIVLENMSSPNGSTKEVA